MMKVGWTASLFLLVALLSPEGNAAEGDVPSSMEFVDTPFRGVCQDVGLLHVTSYEKNKTEWDFAIHSCKANVQVVDSSFFDAILDRMSRMEVQEKQVEFLRKVGAESLARADFNIKISEVWMHCARLVASPSQSEKVWFAEKAASAARLSEVKPEQGKLEADLYNSDKCSDRIKELRALIATHGREFRVQREMARFSGAFWNKTAANLRGAADTILKPFGGEVLTPGERVELTASEKEILEEKKREQDQRVQAEFAVAAKRNLEIYRQEAKTRPPGSLVSPLDSGKLDPWFKEWFQGSAGASRPELPLAQAAQSKAFAQLRSKEFGAYFQASSQALARAPILAFLPQAEPTDSMIAQAAERLWENGIEVRRQTENILKADNPIRIMNPSKGNQRERTPGEKLEVLTKLLRNGAAVREVLSQNPGFCHAAAEALSYASSKGTRDFAAISVGLVAAGLIAPVAIGAGGVLLPGGFVLTAAGASTAFGLATGVGASTIDYLQFREAKQRDLSYVHSETDVFGAGLPVNDLGEFQEARNAFVLNASLTAAFATASMVPPIYRSFMKENEVKYTGSVIQALKSKGMEEGAAKKLLRDFASSDKDTSAAALMKLSQALDVSEAEIKTFQKVVEKQLLDPGTRHLFDDFSGRLMAIKDESQRAALGKRAREIMEQYPAALNPTRRVDAVRVAIAAADFGIDDPAQIKQLAMHVRDWDKGLYGLAVVFDRAKDNLLLTEIRSLPAAAQREAAFKKALEQFGWSKPDVVRQLSDCVGMGK